MLLTVMAIIRRCGRWRALRLRLHLSVDGNAVLAMEVAL